MQCKAQGYGSKQIVLKEKDVLNFFVSYFNRMLLIIYSLLNLDMSLKM